MKNVLLLGYMQDLQTGVYIVEALEKVNYNVNWVDIRTLIKDKPLQEGQNLIMQHIDDIKISPDLIIVLKGVELTHNTIKTIKEKFSNATLVNWFFDVYYGIKKIWEYEEYFETIKLFDYYFCSVHESANKLNDAGFKNVKYLEEACSIEHNGEQCINNFQRKKYKADVAFVGSLGFMLQHPNRIPIITKVVEEAFNMKIWGDIVCAPKYIAQQVLNSHTHSKAINETHSMIVQSSLINIGIDQNPNMFQSHSARLYRVLCAGGLYLLNGTKGINKIFKVNESGTPITKDQHLVMYYNKEDLIEKLDFLLEHEDIRNQIAKNGQKLVLERDTFEHRIKEMIEVIENHN